MSMRESLVQAMRLPADSDALRWLHDHDVAVADADTMSQAIHDVFCGVTADHVSPNDKDRQQAQALIDAMKTRAASGA
jgi:hypothetical protein